METQGAKSQEGPSYTHLPLPLGDPNSCRNVRHTSHSSPTFAAWFVCLTVRRDTPHTPSCLLTPFLFPFPLLLHVLIAPGGESSILLTRYSIRADLSGPSSSLLPPSPDVTLQEAIYNTLHPLQSAGHPPFSALSPPSPRQVNK